MPSKPPGVSAVLQAVDRRSDTDERPSFFTHVVLPILLVLVAAIAGFGIVLATAGYRGGIAQTVLAASSSVVGAAILLLAVAAIAGLVLFVVGMYQVMRRRDRHFARDHALRGGLLDYCRWLAQRNPDTRAGEHVEEMERIHNDARIDEPDRPAAVHMVLTFLFPFWYLYVLYYLTKDIPDHTRRQARFLREVHNVADEAGLEVPEIETAVTVSERSYLLVLFLAIVVPFGNLAVLYWLYDDPEEHFDQQWRHEDELVNIVSDEEAAQAAAPTPSEETDAPEAPDADPDAAAMEEPAEPGPHAEPDAEEDTAPEGEPAFTVWSCSECDTKYKVPPKRPVKVTCKECGNEEILEE